MEYHAEAYAPVNPNIEEIAMVTTTTDGASANRISDMIMSLLLLYVELRKCQAAR